MGLLEDMQLLKKVIENPLNKIAGETGLTVNEIRILLFLYENEKFDIASNIVEKLMVSKAHVSMSVESLVNKNYIEKVQDKKDKKKFHLKLINDSKQVLELLDKERKKLRKNLMYDISIKDRKVFIRTLKKIILNTRDMA